MLFLKRVQEGRRGKNLGLESGLPKLDDFTTGIQRACYTVFGAQQKTGKTAFVDFRYILMPYLIHKQQNKPLNVKWKYFSYEVSKEEKIAKFCAFFMYYYHGILCDSNYVLSRRKNVQMTDHHYQLIEKIYREDIQALFGVCNEETGALISEGYIDFYEDKENPTGIHNHLFKYAELNGKFIREAYSYVDKNGDTQTGHKVVSYVANDPERFVIPIIDHVGLLKREKGLQKKENIDLLSQYFVWFRNICSYSPIAISQFNRDLSKIDRLKFSGEQLQPTVEDFKDTGNLAEDATIVYALFNPTLFKHLDTHLGYKLHLSESGDIPFKGYRSIHILASRNTETGVSLGLDMIGECGFFRELPNPRREEQALEVYYQDLLEHYKARMRARVNAEVPVIKRTLFS